MLIKNSMYNPPKEHVEIESGMRSTSIEYHLPKTDIPMCMKTIVYNQYVLPVLTPTLTRHTIGETQVAQQTMEGSMLGVT